jgi:hypothetical protein
MNGHLLASGTVWFSQYPERIGPAPNALTAHHLLSSCLLAVPLIPKLTVQNGERNFGNSSLTAGIYGFGEFAAFIAETADVS